MYMIQMSSDSSAKGDYDNKIKKILRYSSTTYAGNDVTTEADYWKKLMSLA